MTPAKTSDDTFDPWTATESDAISCYARALEKKGRTYAFHQENPLFQWAAAQAILRLQKSELSPREVLEAINKCMFCNLVVPSWISAKFSEYVDRITSLEARTWQEVFGSPLYAKGTHVASMRRKRDLSEAVFKSVVRALSVAPDRPIDKGLFEEVGAEHGVGATLAEECYALGKSPDVNPRDLLDSLHARRSFRYTENIDGTYELVYFDFFGNPVK